MTTRTVDFSGVIAAVKAATNIVVVGHLNPDGDCVCAMSSAAMACRALGKNVALYNESPIPTNLMFLPGASTITQTFPQGCDLAVVVDCGDLERTGKGQQYLQGMKMVNIDHHETNPFFGAVNVVVTEASSTGELIHDLCEFAGIPITPDLAKVIYCSIVSDTGSFHYDNATPHAFNVAAKMVALGVKPWEIASHLHENQPIERLTLLRMALETLYVSPRSDFASIDVTRKMLETSGASSDLVDGLINYARSLKGVEVAIQFRENKDQTYKVSFRSKGAINVARISQEFGGGGHHNAAGCTLPGPLEQVKAAMYAKVDELLTTTRA